MENRKLKVIISGGGTGGHIFPAIAIANALKKKVADIDILFVGAIGKMEMEKVPAAGYPIEGLWISGFKRSLSLSNLMFPFKLISSLNKAKKIINRVKPDVVIGVGGFASGPLLKIATRKKIPSLIQEQNSFPGVTNKLLANHVNTICVAYDGMEKFFPKEKIIITGNPVRQDVVELSGKAEEAYKFFGINPELKTVFVVGGSLGAFSINESIKNSLHLFKENNVQLVWQTGKPYIETAKEAVKEFESAGIKAFDFINRMDYAYSIADLVVSRAGAIAVSELCLVKKPCILVPFPFAAEDHQTKNAMALVNKNASILIKDSDVREKLSEIVFPLLNDTNKLKELSENISSLAMKNSADLIADEVLKIIK